MNAKVIIYLLGKISAGLAGLGRGPDSGQADAGADAGTDLGG